MKLLMLLLRHFEAFMAPKSINPFEVDKPALFESVA
jgi:hypothetical protein